MNTINANAMIRSLVALVSLCCLSIQLNGQTPGERMRAANDAFQSKQYQSAVEMYEALRGEGLSSAVLYYNLGNSYYRLGALAPAILNYERALLLRPRDRDTRHNLEVARAQLQDELEVLPEFFLLRWWRGLAFAFSATAWSVIGLLLLWLGIGGLVMWLFAGDRRQKVRGFVAGLILLTLCLLPFTLAFSRISLQQHSRTAIVMAPEIELRSAPDPESAEVLTIHEGLKVDLLDQISDWYKVRLQNGEEGWLPQTVVEEI